MAKNQKKDTPEFKQQIVDLYHTGNYSFPQLLTAKRGMKPLSSAEFLMAMAFHAVFSGFKGT